MSGFKKGAATVANWITDLVWENIGDPIAGDWGMTFDAGEIEEYAQATEVLAGALRDYNKEDPVEFPESGMQYFYLMADAVEKFNASGRNMDFVNSQLKVLRDLGYDVTAEDLPATLRHMWVQMTELNLDKHFVPIHDMTWEGQTKAVQGMADALTGLQQQFWDGEISYGDYIDKARQMNADYAEEMRVYYESSRLFAEQRRINGQTLSEEEEAFLAAYDAYQKASGSMARMVEGSIDPFDYYTSKMEEAMETLSDFARCYDEAGDSEKAFAELNEEYGGDALGGSFDKDKLQAWQDMYRQVQEILGSGGTLNGSQSHFLEMYNVMMDFFGEDFLSGVDLESNGGKIAESLGDGIGERLKTYDFTDSGTAVADNLDAAVRGPLGAHSPAARFIPIGVDIAEGLAVGITSGTSLVTNAIVALANAAVAAAKEALQIHSPSRVFRDEIGAMTIAGFGEGVIAQTEAEGKVIRNAARYLTEEASSAAMSGRNTYTTNNYTTDAPISFEGATFSIREEQDVHSLAQEIASLIKREQAGKGFRR